MDPQEAVRIVQEMFPFEGYIEPEWQVYMDVVPAVRSVLLPGARILDFGSGPCDKAAVLQLLGFECHAVDDLRDAWHLIDGNRDRILDFAHSLAVEFHVADERPLPFAAESFDLLMMLSVLEHLHDSPRRLVNELLALVKPRGYLLATVPNAVNLRKRLDVLRGRSNFPPFHTYYWCPGPWRGHVREYTKADVVRLYGYLDLQVIWLRGCHHNLAKLPPAARRIYVTLSSAFPAWRDTWMLLARKREGWKPKEPPTEPGLIACWTPRQSEDRAEQLRPVPGRSKKPGGCSNA